MSGPLVTGRDTQFTVNKLSLAVWSGWHQYFRGLLKPVFGVSCYFVLYKRLIHFPIKKNYYMRGRPRNSWLENSITTIFTVLRNWRNSSNGHYYGRQIHCCCYCWLGIYCDWYYHSLLGASLKVYLPRRLIAIMQSTVSQLWKCTELIPYFESACLCVWFIFHVSGLFKYNSSRHTKYNSSWRTV